MDPIRAENNLDHSIFQNQIPGVISINRLYKLMVHDIHQEQENFKIVKSFISGGIAGALNKTFIAPVERVKYLFVVSHPPCRLRVATLPTANSSPTSS
jgi:hypothetical protein